MRVSIPIAAALVVAATGCEALDEPAALPVLDEAYFRCNVQPIIVKSCSAFVCHGDTARFYRVFGRNRLRYALPSDERNVALSAEELAFNHQSAAAYVNLEDPESSLLLLKPLDQEAGGYYHGGATEYGAGDVWMSKDEDDYKTVLAWVKGAKEDESCTAPGE
jgi:hypothetical protein